MVGFACWNGTIAHWLDPVLDFQWPFDVDKGYRQGIVYSLMAQVAVGVKCVG
jgi:hypothetical protein